MPWREFHKKSFLKGVCVVYKWTGIISSGVWGGKKKKKSKSKRSAQEWGCNSPGGKLRYWPWTIIGWLQLMVTKSIMVTMVLILPSQICTREGWSISDSWPQVRSDAPPYTPWTSHLWRAEVRTKLWSQWLLKMQNCWLAVGPQASLHLLWVSLYSFPMAAVTNEHQPGSLKQHTPILLWF